MLNKIRLQGSRFRKENPIFSEDNSDTCWHGKVPVCPGHSVFLGLMLSLALGTFPPAALSQVIPDHTLGTERSRVTPNAFINGLPADRADRIDGGATRGVNLFHSFLEFNVNPGQRLYFANPSGIANIFSRVTGNSRSDILGTLGVAGSANLFLLNPNGILFGPNAQLDIRGSFLASTADRFDFGNGLGFSATNPQPPPLLKMNVPIGLQYGTTHTGTLTSTANLAVGQNLTLDAGTLDLSGQLQAGGDLTLRALDTLRIRDQVDAPFIAAAGHQLLLQGNQSLDIFALNHPDSGLFSGGNLVLRSATPVSGDAHYWSGGHFRIEQLDGSPGDLFSPHDPIIRASGDVTFTNYVGPSLHILAGGSVTVLGNIDITGPDPINGLQETVTLSDGTSLTIDGQSRPILDIRAGVSPGALGTLGLEPDPIPGITPSPPTQIPNPTRADIRVGAIDLTEPDGLIFLSNQYQPNGLAGDILTTGNLRTKLTSGDGGDIYVDSRNEIKISSREIVTRFKGNPPGPGSSGAVTLLAKDSISIMGTEIDTSTSDGTTRGNGDNITLQADRISLTNTRLDTNAEVPGQGGDINITARQVDFNGVRVTSGAGALFGQAGDITINASESLDVFGTYTLQSPSPSTIGALASFDGGTSGNITIDTEYLSLRDGGFITTATASTGNRGGDLTINASESVELLGTDALPSILSVDNLSGNGAAGNLRVKTKRFLVDNGAVSATSFDEGRGGNITLNASESVKLSGAVNNFLGLDEFQIPSGISARSLGSGTAGNVTLSTSVLSLQAGGQVTVESRGAGDAGTLTVNASTLEVAGTSADGSNPSRLTALSLGTGNAGGIQITTDRLTLREGGLISASSRDRGQGGTIQINASESVQLIGTSSTSQVPTSLQAVAAGSGRAGSVIIKSPTVTVRDGAMATVESSGSGDAGTLAINTNVLSITGTAAATGNPSILTARTGGSGNAGGLDIVTQQLKLQDGGQISANTTGSGNAGGLSVRASGAVEVAGRSPDGRVSSGLFFDTSSSGAGGGIRVDTAGDLTLRNGGEITVRGTGTGPAGNIDISARSLWLSNQGKISAETRSGEGGNIAIRVDESIVLRHNSEISTEARGTGNGGNIRLEAGDFIWAVLSENSDIVANAFQGRGGNIVARTQGIFGFRQFHQRRSAESDFIASSEFGIDGTVTLDVRDFQPDASLSEQFAEAEIGQGCSPNRRARNGQVSGSRFVHTGRGGVPTNPAQALAGSSVRVPWVEGRAEDGGRRTEDGGRRTEDGEWRAKEIVEARGWVRLANGDVLLTARPDAVAAHGAAATIGRLGLPCQSRRGLTQPK